MTKNFLLFKLLSEKFEAAMLFMTIRDTETDKEPKLFISVFKFNMGDDNEIILFLN